MSYRERIQIVGAMSDDALLERLIDPSVPSATLEEQVLRETLHRIFMMLVRLQPSEGGPGA